MEAIRAEYIGYMVDMFSEAWLGDLRLPSRIVMAPMTRLRAGSDGVPTALNATYYAQRASAALMITESTQICAEGASFPCNPGIHTPDQVNGWRLVTDTVHARGGRIFLQLWHAGRAAHPSLLPDGKLPVAPSAIAAEGQAVTTEGWQPHVVPRALELDEIPAVVATYAKAAENARQAGFDGVEIHAANGFLIDQFLRDGSNRREDIYGGSVQNRVRFLCDVVDAVCLVWPRTRVGVRLSPNAWFLGMNDSNPGATFAAAAEAMNRRGVGYLHIVEAPALEEELEGGSLTAGFFRPLFDGAIIANSRYNRDRAEEALREGRADLVSFGRPFIANPDLPERFLHNASLRELDPATIYGGDHVGYTDYPFLHDASSVAPPSIGLPDDVGLSIDIERILPRKTPDSKK